MAPTISTRLPGEGTPAFHHAPVPERTTVRHGLAEDLELGSRVTFDHVAHPFTNWGFANALQFRLDRFAAAHHPNDPWFDRTPTLREWMEVYG